MTRGYEQKTLLGPSVDISTGTLAEKLSWRARHHGAFFYKSRRKIICHGIEDLSRAGNTNLKNGRGARY